jgi:hypothetical protein
MSTAIGTSNNSATYKPQVNTAGVAQASNAHRLGNLFQLIDTAGTGRISKSQFDQSFSNLSLPISIKEMGKDAVFGKLDPNGNGVVSKQEFIKGLEPLMIQKDASSLRKTPVETKPTTQPKEPVNPLVAKLQSGETLPEVNIRGAGFIINTTA